MKDYVYQPGDIVYVRFGSHKHSHIQSGNRPAIVLSSTIYNTASRNLVIVAPISSSNKYHNSRLVQLLPPSLDNVHGAVLLQQIRAIDIHKMILPNPTGDQFKVITRTSHSFVKKCWSILKQVYFR